MKTFKTLLSFVILALCFTACEDDSVKAVLKTEVDPNTLETPTSATYVLTLETKNDIMETFAWSATDFGFKAAVKYTVELDIVGNNFADAITIATTNDLEAAITIGPLNDQLLGLGLTPDEATDVEIRIVSTIGDKVAPIYSNTIDATITAYATSFPPIWGMGAALKGWGPWPDSAVEWQSSEFKKYETVTYLKNGEIFRFFAQLDWGPTSYNYNYFTTVDALFALNPGDGDNNFKVVGASGWYKIGVNLKDKVVTALSVPEPVLYMVGGAINGWNWNAGTPVKMKYIKPGIFVGTTYVSNDIFRFFAQFDWGPTSYNYEYFTSVDANFELNSGDSDKNLRFIGTPGTLKITVDLNAKTVTVGDAPDPVLYITGDDFGWGWNDGQYVSMTYKGGNNFEATVNLTNNSLFRFFPQKDWSPSYTYADFTTIDSELADQGPSTDHNFRYTGTTGSRKITVNVVTKTVAVD